jgi:hypothetical protein
MKKIYSSLALLFLTILAGKAQLIQASIGAGSIPNSVKIYIRSATAQPTTNISTLQFNIGIATAITPAPTTTVRSTSIAGVTWVVIPFTEGGYNNYSIQTAASPLVFNLPANTDYEVMEVAFTNGPITPQNVSLVTLPDGGTTGNGLFLCTGSYTSQGNNLYYTRSGVTVNNQFSYDQTGTTSGTATSTATIGGIPLPTKFLSFFATKSNDEAKLTWTVDNEEDNQYFDVEGSTDGRTFTALQRVNALRNGRASNTYSATDATISRYRVKTVYYRIKQVESSGTVLYSEVRQMNLSDKSFAATLYPNPVKTITKLVVDAPEAAKATIIIRDANGKTVKQMTLQLTRGINQQQIDATLFAAGDYNLTIVADKLNQTIKLTKSN